MKTAIVTYSDGTIMVTDINGTDEEIENYFAVGRMFNIGIGENDNMQPVLSCGIFSDEDKPCEFGPHVNSHIERMYHRTNRRLAFIDGISDIETLNKFRKHFVLKSDNMQHLFIPYKLALIAKEEGFNDRGMLAFWDSKIDQCPTFCNPITKGWQNTDFKDKIGAPLYQQIEQWLYEEKSLLIRRETCVGYSIKTEHDNCTDPGGTCTGVRPRRTVQRKYRGGH